MAALRDIARDFAAEIRDGIGWTIVYRTGRSWNALTIWSDIWNGEWETDDLNDAIGILKADPDAVIVNGYYCGHFGEDMTIDEIAAGIRWHYEGGRNRLADYCEATQGRDALEEGRKAAEAAGLPFCERLAESSGRYRPRPSECRRSGCTSQLTQRKPEPGRSTATASGAMFSRLWLRKEVEAHDSQVRRLRARLERQHLPEDPPHRLHLPAL